MDPLSVIGGVSSIVGFALHGSRRLYELIDGTRNAPKDVKELSKEIKAFYNVLGDLQRLLQRRPDDGTVADVLQSNQESLEQCLNILDELMLNIRSHTKPSPDVKTSTWQGFLWSFKVKDVRILMDRLGNRKATLLMALTTVNMYAGYFLGYRQSTIVIYHSCSKKFIGHVSYLRILKPGIFFPSLTISESVRKPHRAMLLILEFLSYTLPKPREPLKTSVTKFETSEKTCYEMLME